MNLKFLKNDQILFLVSYAKQYKKDIIFALFFICIATLSILYIGFLVQGLTVNLSQSSKSSEVLYFSLLIMLCVIVSSIAVFGRIFFFGRLGEKLIKDLRDSLFKHLIKQDVYFFESHRTGEIVSRIMSDTHVIQLVLIGTASSAVRNSILLLGSSIMMLCISPLLFIILSVGSCLLAIPSIFFGRKIRQLSKKGQLKSADISSHIEETFNAIKTIKSNCYENNIFNTYYEKTLAECEVICRRIIFFGLSVSINSFVLYSVLISILFISYSFPQLFNLSLENVSSFAYYGLVGGYSLSQFSELFSDFYRASGASDRIRELFKVSPTLIENEQVCKKKENSKTYIEFKDINFSYPSNPKNKILKDINFKIYEGEHVALVGSSGSGKSTIFNLILRFYDPLSGKIFFDGKELSLLKFNELRSKMSIVPQDPFIFSTTILDNIRLGMENCTFNEVRKAAELSYSLDFIEKLPEDFNSYVGEKGIRLSGGQKQRLAIARAILRNPNLLLLDEATSSLDSESEHYIKLSIEKFLKNKTCLIIAHRLSTIKHCDKILLLENGEIIDVGEHKFLLKNNSYYSKLVEMQFMQPLSLQSA